VRFEEIEALRRHHPAWRLLRAETAPLVLSFLSQVFVEGNARSIAASDLVRRLDDVLYVLREELGDGAFPRSAASYVSDWSAPDAGWLRKFYPPGATEPYYDATPDVERALAWLATLQPRTFVGTESRLKTVFDLLRQIAQGSETDPDVRIAELRRRRTELDAEIARAERGEVDVLDEAGRRDRYQQFAVTARALLSDFREVEANFRALDRDLRQRIAAWDGSKGDLLEDVLGDRSSIADSDQGRSFHAFYDFLLSPPRQEEFRELLGRVQALAGAEADSRMRHIHHDWLEAGERTQATVRLLSEQLRRFLDDRVWLENRRVVELLRGIESTSLALRDARRVDFMIEMEAAAPPIALPMERPLYTPSAKPAPLDSTIREELAELETDVLFEQVFVDRSRLAGAVRHALRGCDQVALPDVLADAPLEQGLAELVTYLALDDDSFDVVFDEQVRTHVTWRDADGRGRTATVPAVTFVRYSVRTDAG
jgi:hypothetical protein